MKRRWWLVLVALVVLAAVFWQAMAADEGAEDGVSYALSEEEVAMLQPGDIILRRGHGLVSDLISSVLSEEYDVSHCGIVAEHDSALWVIHSVSSSVSEADGMQAHRLQAFVQQSKPSSVIVSRLRTDADRSLIALRAKELLRR
ncbi:MAG TPA: YiiX/YebB-like N1pC/P60 family cysteine hydrolase [Flavobacteriales bacterium]|nr:YiiX/YebB-like N1pC/P60 family cysteine hydrolase [Flavobacteriales bacterium]